VAQLFSLGKMKTILSAAILIVIILIAGKAAAQTEGTNRIYTYGVPPDQRICVKICGGGVRKSGVYYIKKGSSLHDLLSNDKAEWLRSSDGTFRIIRSVNGEKIVKVVDYTEWDIRLLDGDAIYAPRTEGILPPNMALPTTPKPSSTPILPILNR